MNVKGQGALEYLLLIGGAVLVAAIVIALITGIPGTTPSASKAATCASQFTCTDCLAKTVEGTANGCKAQLTDATTLNTTVPCTTAQQGLFKACVPD